MEPPTPPTPLSAARVRSGACLAFLGSLRALLDSGGCECVAHSQGLARRPGRCGGGGRGERRDDSGGDNGDDSGGGDNGDDSGGGDDGDGGGGDRGDDSGDRSEEGGGAEEEEEDDDDDPARQLPFGVVYADYCCSLYAGRTDVEKSPVHDLIALFGRRALAPRAVLAVTLARPDAARPRFPREVAAAVAAAAVAASDAGAPGDEAGPAGEGGGCPPCGAAAGFESDDDAQVLSAAVQTLAARAGWQARPGPEAFDFRGTFVRLWSLSKRR